MRLSAAVEAKLQEMLRLRSFVVTEAVSDERVRRFISQLSEQQVRSDWLT